MYEINKVSKELNPVEEYALTSSPASKRVKDIPDNEVVHVAAWCEFTRTEQEEGKDPKTTELLSILTSDNHIYMTPSKTFKRSFADCVTACKDFDVIPIIKISGVSKNGREFVDCALAIEEATKLISDKGGKK